MEIRNGIPQPDLDEAPVSFPDFAAHFSKAEWKLLHKWQTELYDIVMKEIQQALTSLGPRISDCIFSLRPKEKEDLFLKHHQDTEIRNKTNSSPRSAAAVPMPSLSDDDERAGYSVENQDSEGGRGTIGFTERAVNTSVIPFRIKEEKASCFDDYLIPETRESIGSPAEHDALAQIVSFIIKEDGASSDSDHQDSESRESSNTPTAVQQLPSEAEERPVASINFIQLRHPSMVLPHVIKDGVMAKLVVMRPGHAVITHHKKDEETHSMDQYKKMESIRNCSSFSHVEPEERTHFHEATELGAKTAGEESSTKKIKSGYSVADTKIRREGRVLDGITQVKFHKSIVERTRSRSHLSSGSNHYLACGKSSHRQKVSMRPKYSIFQGSTSSIQGSDKYNAFERNLWHENLLTNQPNAQINFRPYACLQCGKFFKTRTELTRHHRTHSGERPYHCMICGHNFGQRQHLIRHQRTHTGERPYQCMECKKRFGFKQTLNRHQRTHLVTFKTTHIKSIISGRNPT